MSGGVQYKKISERDDYMAKVAILMKGGIIFPTLSDKSTWFYITGCNLPGINYNSISSTNKASLIRLNQFGKTKELHVDFDYSKNIGQLD
jgi:hypothetical protein